VIVRRWLRALCLPPLLLMFLASTPAARAADDGGASTAAPVKAAAVATGRPIREIFGFALAGRLADPNVGYASWNFDDLSTVAFFALHIAASGGVIHDTSWTIWNSATLTGLVSTAHAHGVKVVVAITAPSARADQCSALYNDQVTVTQIVAEVQAKGVDGVNIDYEGSLANCNTTPPTTPTSNQALVTRLAKDMRAGLDAVNASYYLSIDTYSGSAMGSDGFFNIPALNPYVDSFFVMAYDMDYANQSHSPLNCPKFCLAPVSPQAGYWWNDTNSMNQYKNVVGGAKVILGQPYYGRVACVASATAHAVAQSYLTAATYIEALAVATSPDVKPGTFRVHRDATDVIGQDRWDTWYDLSLGCWREMYWSDAATLTARYKLVNDLDLRGVGFWTLDYGGGSPELWSTISTYFKSCYALSVSASPPSPQLSSTAVTVTGAATCPDADPVYRFYVQAPGSTAYKLLRDYATDANLAWDTTGLKPGGYRFSVWARDANSLGRYGNASGTWDVYSNSFVYQLTSKPCTSVGASAAPASPAGVGAGITISATAAGCPNALFNFSMLAPGATSYQVVQAYSSSATFNWSTAGLKPGTYRFSVWARDVSSWGVYGNSAGRWDAYNNATVYTLKSCTGVTVLVSPPSPKAAGTTVTVTANGAGCPNPSPLYRFALLAPGATSYQLVQDYSTNATFTWNTTGLAPGTYRFSIWVKDAQSGGAAGNSAGRWDAYNNGTTYTLS